MAQQPRKGKDHPDAQLMQENREERQRQTEEAMKRMETSQPTPTQEENDLAKMGIAVDDKEDDKSGRTVITRAIVANEPLGPGGFEAKEAREARKAYEQQVRQQDETRRQEQQTRRQQQARE
jgi:hypothetical protein